MDELREQVAAASCAARHDWLTHERGASGQHLLDLAIADRILALPAIRDALAKK